LAFRYEIFSFVFERMDLVVNIPSVFFWLLIASTVHRAASSFQLETYWGEIRKVDSSCGGGNEGGGED
jgi:hypothetical protein